MWIGLSGKVVVAAANATITLSTRFRGSRRFRRTREAIDNSRLYSAINES